MPLQAYTRERDERRLIGFVYFGTLVLLLILLYATYANIQRYSQSVEKVRQYNAGLRSLQGVLSSLQDQETGARGYLLTADSAYLAPYLAAQDEYAAQFALARVRLKGSDVENDLDSLQRIGDRVRESLTLLLARKNLNLLLDVDIASRMSDAKKAMDALRFLQTRLVSRVASHSDTLLVEERRQGLDAPTMIVVYSMLAIAATALLFWRLSRSLRITERSKLDLQLKLAELDHEVRSRTTMQEMLQSVLDISPNGIMAFRPVTDARGTIVDFEFLSSNPKANEFVMRTDLVGKRLLQEMPENGTTGLFDAYVSVVRTGVPFQKEFHYQGSGIDRWFSSHAVRFKDGFMVTFMDITEQKRAREVNAESDRIALTGQITRTVAHEVRNPLTNIHLAVEQLQDEVEDRKDVVEPFFQIIDRNLKRIGTLINGMLESSKKRELELSPCTVEDVVKSAMDQVEDRLSLKGMKQEVSVAPGLPQVMVDSDLIDLALTNITVNAVEAMETGVGRLTMSARRSGDEVLMEISDNGKGIAPENLNRLFEPFYSGRPGGLGLGLTTTRSILNSHRIKLEVRSTVGQGTTFTLRFPSAIFANGK